MTAYLMQTEKKTIVFKSITAAIRYFEGFVTANKVTFEAKGPNFIFHIQFDKTTRDVEIKPVTYVF